MTHSDSISSKNNESEADLPNELIDCKNQSVKKRKRKN